MCKCKELRDSYEGLRVEDIPELSSKLREIETDFKRWETIYVCIECGQKWLEKYVSTGHGDVPKVYKAK